MGKSKAEDSWPFGRPRCIGSFGSPALSEITVIIGRAVGWLALVNAQQRRTSGTSALSLRIPLLHRAAIDLFFYTLSVFLPSFVAKLRIITPMRCDAIRCDARLREEGPTFGSPLPRNNSLCESLPLTYYNPERVMALSQRYVAQKIIITAIFSRESRKGAVSCTDITCIIFHNTTRIVLRSWCVSASFRGLASRAVPGIRSTSLLIGGDSRSVLELDVRHNCTGFEREIGSFALATRSSVTCIDIGGAAEE